MPSMVTLSHEPPEDFPRLLHPCLIVAGLVTLSSPDSPGLGWPHLSKGDNIIIVSPVKPLLGLS